MTLEPLKKSIEDHVIYCCPENDCIYSLDITVLDDQESAKKVMWLKNPFISDEVIPGCPEHGIALIPAVDMPC